MSDHHIADRRSPIADQSPITRSPIANCFAVIYQPGSVDSGKALLAIAREFSPRYEQRRDDLVVIDVSGLGRLIRPRVSLAPDGLPREGSAPAYWKTIGEELRREATDRGVRVHVAVAATQTTALVLAQSRAGLTVVDPGREAEALASQRVDMLERIPGAEGWGLALPALAAIKRWGLQTLGEIAALPAAELTARIGRQGAVWQAIARGDDVRPLVPERPEERFEATLELEWPIEGLEPLSFVLTRLLEPLSIRLERRDRGAAVFHVLLRLVTRESYARRLQLPSPIRDVRTLRTLALLDLDAHPPSAAIDAVTVVIDPTPGRVLQHTLFERPHPTPEQLSTLLARLGALMGSDRVGAPATVDSYRPGAFEVLPFNTEGPRMGDVAMGDRQSGMGDRRSGDGRYGVTSPIADSHIAETSPIADRHIADVVTSAFRRCRPPIAACVSVEGGRPVQVTTTRQGFTGGRVERCAGPWLSSGHWWTEGHEKSSAWTHEEWEVALTDGAVYRIYRECSPGAHARACEGAARGLGAPRATEPGGGRCGAALHLRWFIEAIVD